MKQAIQKTKIILIIILLMSFSNSKAQWLTTGNPGITGANFIGPLNVAPLNFQTSSIPRGTISAAGNWGIGNYTTFAPASMLHLHDGVFGTFQQFTNGLTGPFITDGFRIGLIGQNAVLWQQEAFPMFFVVNGAIRKTILANGNVGIGAGFTTPNNLLDVNGGDIDVNTTTNGYMINNDFVLRHKGDKRNIF